MFSTAILISVLVVLYAIGLISMEYGFSSERKLLRDGVAIVATITGRRAANSESSSYWITYRFVNPMTRRESTRSFYLSKQLFDSSSDWETMTVLLMPHTLGDPVPYFLMTKAEIVGATRRSLVG